MYSTRYSCHILIRYCFSRQVFEELLNIKYNENPSSGSRVVSCRRCDVWGVHTARIFKKFVVRVLRDTGLKGSGVLRGTYWDRPLQTACCTQHIEIHTDYLFYIKRPQ
jgi:hypothetical protein